MTDRQPADYVPPLSRIDAATHVASSAVEGLSKSVGMLALVFVVLVIAVGVMFTQHRMMQIAQLYLVGEREARKQVEANRAAENMASIKLAETCERGN